MPVGGLRKAPITACLVLAVHRDLGDAGRFLAILPAVAATRCGARRPGTAAFPSQSRRRSTSPAASPSRSAGCSARCVFRAREHVDHAAARRHRGRRGSTSSCTIWSGSMLLRAGSRTPSMAVVEPPQQRAILTIRRYLSLVFGALVRCCWWMVAIWR
ncbi:MAG: hypothetical protein MZV49_26360 [Rhodopseudomonas palustris]|nr:hypothetical protein [Rhodopseudomonas palustris]